MPQRTPAGRPTPARRVPKVLLVAAALLCSSCFERPVIERMEIRFLPDGTTQVSVAVELMEPERFRANAAARERIERARRALREGSDDWSRRFEAMEPSSERVTIHRQRGEIRRVSRAAVVEDPSRALPRFFADTPLAVTFGSKEGVRELVILNGGGDRATVRQRRKVRSGIAGWSRRIEAYLSAAADLFEYLEERPDRAAVCLAGVLDDVVSDSGLGGEETDETEAALINAVHGAMASVLVVAEVEREEAFSLDEMSRLVYDPFPAPLRVELPAPASEIEGFRAEEGGTVLSVPELSLLGALTSFEGVWLEPDPLSTILHRMDDAGRIRGAPLDIRAYAARPRRARRVAARDIREALEDRLEAPAVFRARWGGSED